MAVLLFAITVFTQETQTVPTPDIGTPVFTISAEHVLGTAVKVKTKLALPLGLPGEVQIDSFDAKSEKLTFRLKLDKKARGNPPEGYNSCTFGEPHVLTTKDSCVFWLKDAKAFLTVSWDHKGPDDNRVVLTVDHWHITE